MTIKYGFCLSFLSLSLAFLISCAGDEFSAAWVGHDAQVQDTKPEKPQKDVNQGEPDAAKPDADAGKPDVDAAKPDADAEGGMPEADATPQDVLEVSVDTDQEQDALEEPDVVVEDAQSDDVESEDAQLNDVLFEDALPDSVIPDAEADVGEDVTEEPDAPVVDVQLEIEPPVDAKPPVTSPLCEQNMPLPEAGTQPVEAGANQNMDVFIVGQAALGPSVRLSIMVNILPPADSGPNLTGMGCWGDLGQTKLVCAPIVSGQGVKGVLGMKVQAHPGIATGYGDPQSAPLCSMGSCQDSYVLCWGPYQMGAFSGVNPSNATLLGYMDQTIEYSPLSKP